MSDTPSADTKVGGGSSTAAASGATIASVTGLTAGQRYRLRLYLSMSGTIDTVNTQNFVLKSGGVNLVTNLPSVPNFDPIIIDQVTTAAGATDFTVAAGAAAFAAGCVVSAVISATRIG